VTPLTPPQQPPLTTTTTSTITTLPTTFGQHNQPINPQGVRSVSKKGKETMYDLDEKINFSVFPGFQVQLVGGGGGGGRW
jgi:hypothetical protein